MTETKAAMQNAAQYVVDNMSQRGMLEQLAEECSELAKASLKLIRAAGLSDNPTPTGRAEAIDMLQEEIDDVVSLIFLLTGDKRLEYMRDYWKIERWACRLACGCEAEEDNNEAKRKKLSQRYVWTEKAAKLNKNCKAGEELQGEREDWILKKMKEHGIIKEIIMEVDNA